MEERAGERRCVGLVGAAPLLGPLPTPPSWGEEVENAFQEIVAACDDSWRYSCSGPLKSESRFLALHQDQVQQHALAEDAFGARLDIRPRDAPGDSLRPRRGALFQR